MSSSHAHGGGDMMMMGYMMPMWFSCPVWNIYLFKDFQSHETGTFIVWLVGIALFTFALQWL